MAKQPKFKKKINRRVGYYDSLWDRQEVRLSGLCDRALRSRGFQDGAEWMLEEVVHLLRQKKYKCDKLVREAKDDREKSVPIFASAVYSKIIKELTE